VRSVSARRARATNGRSGLQSRARRGLNDGLALIFVTFGLANLESGTNSIFHLLPVDVGYSLLGRSTHAGTSDKSFGQTSSGYNFMSPTTRRSAMYIGGGVITLIIIILLLIWLL